MIQFNLLPDVKIEFIKAKRLKNTIVLVSIISASAALFILIVLVGFVNGAQKKHMNDLTKDIKKYDNQLQGTKDLDKILTIQNQLNSLVALHDAKPAATRLFDDITAITPAAVSISKFDIDFTLSTITIEGNADTLVTVNKFIDTLKFTTYKATDGRTDNKAFSDTVMTTFNRDEKNATYTINAKFNPDIFNSKLAITLTVPKIISTRSETEKPTALFSK